MARDLEELFGEGEGTPEPRTGPALAAAVIGVFAGILGLACPAPGGAIVLIGLWWIERELDRVDNGYLPDSARPAVERARRIVLVCLGLVIVLFFAQAWLFCTGFYQSLGDTILGISPAM